VRSTLLGEAGWHRADFAEARTLYDGAEPITVDGIAQEPTDRRGRSIGSSAVLPICKQKFVSPTSLRNFSS